MLTVRDVQRETDEWGLTEVHGGTAELTPAGVAVALRLAEDIGITVLALPDPATASAADLVELIGRVGPEQWRADAAAWAQRRDGREAAQALAAALGEPDREASVVLAGLIELLERLWRVERPGTTELLEAIGAHHPDRSVTKAARKCLVRHRSRIANSR